MDIVKYLHFTGVTVDSAGSPKNRNRAAGDCPLSSQTTAGGGESESGEAVHVTDRESWEDTAGRSGVQASHSHVRTLPESRRRTKGLYSQSGTVHFPPLQRDQSTQSSGEEPEQD